MITSVLIDDEKASLDTLEWKIENYCPNIKVIDKIGDSRLAIDSIVKNRPDCIFLDVNMPKISGFDLIENLGDIESYIVLVTAYEEYALQAIKASVFDYLLKPVDKCDLISLTKKMQKDLVSKSLYRSNRIHNVSIEKKIGIQVKGLISFYELNEVIFLKAEGSYTRIFLTNNRMEMISKNLKETISLLPDNEVFFRVHNSYHINLNHITKYYKHQGGTLIMSNNESVSVSRCKKTEILKRIL
ncbi:LytR/AlgR family response regulator transcription factor [Aquimarina algicola]|uniref:Response regulator transcription factor n=1 Tax=Aquimarina algicola TaxID=2589995 RepID=A0A504J1D3_9FLAO|nr:LytTR family DNA-binding domain-containing protein [Aquimarina algicola]TPN84647.1 response regulator transcription factor [Aquimarina algicola]